MYMKRSIKSKKRSSKSKKKTAKRRYRAGRRNPVAGKIIEMVAGYINSDIHEIYRKEKYWTEKKHPYSMIFYNIYESKTDIMSDVLSNDYYRCTNFNDFFQSVMQYALPSINEPYKLTKTQAVDIGYALRMDTRLFNGIHKQIHAQTMANLYNAFKALD
jgi:hypothetical protein